MRISYVPGFHMTKTGVSCAKARLYQSSDSTETYVSIKLSRGRSPIRTGKVEPNSTFRSALPR